LFRGNETLTLACIFGGVGLNGQKAHRPTRKGLVRCTGPGGSLLPYLAQPIFPVLAASKKTAQEIEHFHRCQLNCESSRRWARALFGFEVQNLIDRFRPQTAGFGHFYSIQTVTQMGVAAGIEFEGIF
jgi:hypothetical protein